MLQSRIKLDTRYSTRDSAIQFSKIAKNMNLDWCLSFLNERKHCPYQNHEIKNGGHRTRFCARAAESVHQMHFLRFLREDWGEI